MKKNQFFILEMNLMSDDQLGAMMLEMNSAESFGIYMTLLLHLRAKNDYEGSCGPVAIKVIARRYGFDPEMIDRVIRGYGLFEVDEETQMFRSPYLDRVMKPFDEKWERDVENGKKGGRPPKKRKSAETPASNGQKPPKNPNITIDNNTSITPVEYNSSNTENNGSSGFASSAAAVTSGGEMRERPTRPAGQWEKLVDKLPECQEYMERAAMHSGLGAFFVEHQDRIMEHFKTHVKLYSKENGLLYLDDVKRYFSNYVGAGSKTCKALYDALLAEDMTELRKSFNRFEQIVDGQRFYLGHPIPDDAPARPDATAVWDEVNHKWGH